MKSINLQHIKNSFKMIKYIYDFIIAVVFVFIIGLKDSIVDVAFIMFPNEAVNYISPSVFGFVYNLFIYFIFCFLLILKSVRTIKCFEKLWRTNS